MSSIVKLSFICQRRVPVGVLQVLHCTLGFSFKYIAFFSLFGGVIFSRASIPLGRLLGPHALIWKCQHPGFMHTNYFLLFSGIPIVFPAI